MFGRGRSLAANFSDRRHYEHEIALLHEKVLTRPWFAVASQGDIPLSTVNRDRRRFSKLLARAVRNGEYVLGTATTVNAAVHEKIRELFRFNLTDRIVHGAVARALSSDVNPHLSSYVHSYLKGRNWHEPVRDFCAYVRRHRRTHPEVRTRGLYVLRRDIRKYSDSIPIVEHAPIWGLLREVLADNYGEGGISEREWALLQGLVRPVIALPDGSTCCRIRGIPTGSPITATLYNLCAKPLDEALASIPGAFYARYSDDFLFAHPDARVAQEADRVISRTLESLGLEANAGKESTLYFTAAGRMSGVWPDTSPAQHVPFLGCRIGFDGTISLKPNRVRAMLREMRRRVESVVRLSERTEPGVLGPLICKVINRSLNIDAQLRVKHARHLRFIVTDREQLRQLDYFLALVVAETVSGVCGPRAFRGVPYRTIRRRWGLLSLYHARNRVG